MDAKTKKQLLIGGLVLASLGGLSWWLFRKPTPARTISAFDPAQLSASRRAQMTTRPGEAIAAIRSGQSQWQRLTA